jgi:hypothetical protein
VLRRGGSHNDHLDIQIKTPEQVQQRMARDEPMPKKSGRFGGIEPFEFHHIPKE